jgi:hypothetical protein
MDNRIGAGMTKRDEHTFEVLTGDEGDFMQSVMSELANTPRAKPLVDDINATGSLTGDNKAKLFELRFGYGLHGGVIQPRYEVAGEGQSTLDFGFASGGNDFLVEMMRQVLTNVEKPTWRRLSGPLNQFMSVRENYPSNHGVILPSTDTLYTLAWVDVTKEPIIFGAPAILQPGLNAPIVFAGYEDKSIRASDLIGQPLEQERCRTSRVLLIHPINDRKIYRLCVDQFHSVTLRSSCSITNRRTGRSPSSREQLEHVVQVRTRRTAPPDQPAADPSSLQVSRPHGRNESAISFGFNGRVSTQSAQSRKLPRSRNLIGRPDLTVCDASCSVDGEFPVERSRNQEQVISGWPNAYSTMVTP